MKKKKWELAAMTAVTAFLMLGTKAEAMDDAYRMPQLSGVTKTWVYQGETSDRNWERMLADDQEDGDLTSVIKSSGSVNTSKTGTYVLSRSVTDSDQHTAALDTQVTVLDRNASEEEKSIQRILYTLPDASHLTAAIITTVRISDCGCRMEAVFRSVSSMQRNFSRILPFSLKTMIRRQSLPRPFQKMAAG